MALVGALWLGSACAYSSQQGTSLDEGLPSQKLPRRVQTGLLKFREEKQPMVIMHISKTGGSSLLQQLAADKETSLLGYDEPEFFSRWEQCLSLLDTSRATEVQFKMRPRNFVLTFFRTPRSHVLSQYLECRFDPWGQNVTNQTSFPRNGSQIDDFVQWIDHFHDSWSTSAGDYGCYNPWNMQTRSLTCDEKNQKAIADGAVWSNVQPLAETSRLHHVYQDEDVQPDIELAKQHLEERVDFVGLTEFFEESWCLLQYQLHEKLPERGCECGHFQELNLPHERHFTPEDSLRVHSLDKRTLRKIDRMTRADRDVYDTALSLFLMRLRNVERNTGHRLVCEHLTTWLLGGGGEQHDEQQQHADQQQHDEHEQESPKEHVVSTRAFSVSSSRSDRPTMSTSSSLTWDLE